MSDEKTEEGSHQKFQDARDKGQTARSQDLTQACGQLLAVIFLGGCAISLWDGLSRGLMYNLGHLGQQGVSAPISMLEVWKLVGAALMAGLIGGVMSHYVSVGWLLTSHPIQPDINRLNPLQNGKRFFSPKIMVEAVRLFIKVGGSLAIAWGYLQHDLLPMTATAGAHVQLTAVFATALKSVVQKLAFFHFTVGALDLLYQKWEFKRSMRMSKYDLKQEYKQREGDPHVKHKARALGHKLIKQRSLAGVSKASVVITNPTHLAVAIEFNFGLPAPRIVAKGADNVAAAIRKMAGAQNIPIVRDVPLARALYPLEVDEFIPPELYAPVAEILVAVARAEDKHAL
jgi:flagellar biosynthesis protein FlhB